MTKKDSNTFQYHYDQSWKYLHRIYLILGLLIFVLMITVQGLGLSNEYGIAMIGIYIGEFIFILSVKAFLQSLRMMDYHYTKAISINKKQTVIYRYMQTWLTVCAFMTMYAVGFIMIFVIHLTDLFTK